MSRDDYEAYDAVGLAGLVGAGKTSPAELLEAALARAEALNPQLNALVHLQPEVARRLIAEGLPEGPLRGVPFLLKDLGAERSTFRRATARGCWRAPAIQSIPRSICGSGAPGS